METFVAVVHILTALAMIALILVQDSKSGGGMSGTFGGGGSNSVFGATGATTLAQKMTRGAAVVFALTSITLTIFASHATRSVIDSTPIPTAAPAVPGAGTETAPVGAGSAAPAQAAPEAAPAAGAPTK